MLSMADGAVVDIYQCNALAPNEQWKFTSYAVWQQIAAHSSKCLTVSGASSWCNY